MTDESSHMLPRVKGRSASICVASSASMEAISSATPLNGIDTSDIGTPVGRRRKPANRSQSARVPSGRSIKRRVAVRANLGTSEIKNHFNSEPKLAENARITPEVSPSIGRKGIARRGTSVYHRKSTAFLDVPDQRTATSATEKSEEDDDSYRLRSFSFTSKGVINRGDSFKRRKSHINNVNRTENHGITAIKDESKRNSTEISKYVVALLGANGVGKTALINQFMTSECINAYDRQKDNIDKKAISIMLNGEESELTFTIISNSKDINQLNSPDAFVILYSVVDKASFLKAESDLNRLQDTDFIKTKPIILAANKIDLARSRAVSTRDGKCLACTFRAKFIEISVGINHNVDELLVGILTQIKLKSVHCDKSEHQSYWYKRRSVIRASMKARQMFTWLFGKEDAKFKNCENLHIL